MLYPFVPSRKPYSIVATSKHLTPATIVQEGQYDTSVVTASAGMIVSISFFLILSDILSFSFWYLAQFDHLFEGIPSSPWLGIKFIFQKKKEGFPSMVRACLSELAGIRHKTFGQSSFQTTKDTY